MINLHKLIKSEIAGAVNALGLSISIAFLCLAIFSQKIDWTALIEKTYNQWWILVFCVVLGLVSNLMLVYGWRSCLLAIGIKLNFTKTLKIYGKSQIAKYLPGNLGHLAGRQILGKQAGLSHKDLIYSQFFEIAILVMVSAAIGALGIQSIKSNGLEVGPTNIIYACAAVSCIVLLFFLINATNKDKSIISVLFYMSFFVINGFVLVILFGVVCDVHRDLYIDYKAVFSSFSASWIIGFLTPGSPAGMGSREIVSLYYLKDIVRTEVIVEALVLSRLCSMLSDALLFIISSMSSSIQQRRTS